MFLIFILVLGIARSWACPDSCTCKWKGGKQSVECVNKSLNTIPSGMDQNTQVLDFSGNNLIRLHKNKFKTLGLVNLQKIFFPRCGIKTIDRDAFKSLSNLVELDLSENLITSVPSESFQDFPLLMRLLLNGNPIENVRASAFRRLTYLTSLEMSNCHIKTVEDGAFEGLANIEWLKLDNNKLKFIKGSNILPIHLHGVALDHNPWHCDCNLIDLRTWLGIHSIPQNIDPICEGPQRLKNGVIKNLAPDDLACVPEVTPTTFYLEISEGQNVSLSCNVNAIPEARVTWWYQGELLQNDSTVAPGLHLYYFLEEGTTEKVSELFIFNTNVDDNGTFVCIAENQAGRSHSNYTIRILLKEEPVHWNSSVFPYAYFLTIAAGVVVVILIALISLIVCLVQCRRQKKRKRKKDRSKVAALHSQQQLDKTPVMRDEAITRVVNNTMPLPKANGAIIGQEMMAFTTGPGVLVLPNNLNYTAPPVTQQYPEKNPDLINDTSSKEWNKTGEEADTIWNGGTLPRRDVFPKHLTADVHLSPGKFIDADGYPIDYGLPKLPGRFPVVVPPPAFYRTLPHKPRQGVTARFSREAECVQYTPDVRYTAEGYPCFQDPFISPPAGYRSDAASQWPESGLDSLRSVSAQTTEAEPPVERQALTESPDEGYVGEGGESAVN